MLGHKQQLHFQILNWIRRDTLINNEGLRRLINQVYMYQI